ncbi:hypothetical protein NQ318_015301 [Aromia moschata]|uniref:Tc1-like transposase DDE domain-containing protein n=1 Tax=Aromia moschata TaxID=1265417 RepID=A0AAV8X460_9CUCU|nr:hypothetical protein NQ318_015301 [Aromia moschata]
MIGYGDRARTQCEVVRLFRETHPDLPPLNQGTISKIEAQYREMGHVRKVPSKRQAVVDDDTKLNLLLALEENPNTPARQLARHNETWFDTHDVVKYGWVDSSPKCALNTPCSRGKRIIILHAGSENGFVPNALLLSAKNISQSSADYHEDMTANLFEKWFSEQLLPNIPPKSVIVMDNAPYHSRILNKIPNITTKKEDILKFMRNKNMNIPEKIPVKRKLFELIKEQKIVCIDSSTSYLVFVRFHETGGVKDRPKSGRPVSVTNEENSLNVMLDVVENPINSTQQRALIWQLSTIKN